MTRDNPVTVCSSLRFWLRCVQPFARSSGLDSPAKKNEGIHDATITIQLEKDEGTYFVILEQEQKCGCIITTSSENGSTIRQ